MVRCAKCGYLAVRSKGDNSLIEAAIDYRERAVVAIGYDYAGRNQHKLHGLRPVCFAMQPYLEKAVKKIDESNNEHDQVRDIINQDINCKGFADWHGGFTPKEHREMADKRADRYWHWGELALTLIVGSIIAVLASLVGRG